MPMDPQLAEIYGTSSEDTEKLAAAEMAEGLAEEGEIDPENLTDEQVEMLAQQALAGEEGAEVEAAEGEEGAEVEEPGVEKVSEAQEKLAEADYLGRVMAHAYTQELRKIASAETEKTAGPRFEAAKGKAKEVGGKVWGHMKAHKKKYIGGGAALAAAGTGAALYKRHKKKHSSALDTIAEQRALEILAENGIDPNAQEKTSAADEQAVLAEAVEKRAYEMLAEAGYVSEE